MSTPLVYRENKLFRINKALLPSKANNPDVINALYFAMFKEFADAVKQDKYKHLTYSQKMDAINIFANAWLQEQGFK